MKLKLFGIGSKAEKKSAIVLPENLAALFGGAEGQEMVVEATEEGAKAIESAEEQLVKANETYEAKLAEVAELKKKADKAESLETENEKLKEEKDSLEAENEKLGAENGANPTVVKHTEDSTNAGGQKKYDFELEEEKVQKEAEEFNEKFNL